MFEWERYRSPRTHLRVVRVLLGLTSVAAGGCVVIAARALDIDDWSTNAGRRAGEVAVIAGVVASLCCVATYVALAVWCGRMYRNLFTFSSGDLRFTPGWGVGAWFVPFLNLVRPKQIVDDIWRATDPEVGPSRSWRGAPVSKGVHVWWALLLITIVFAPKGNGEGEPPDPTCVGVGVLGAVCMVVFCGFSWFVTSELTSRMESFAARRGQLLRARVAPVGPPRGRLGTWGPVVVSGLAFVGLAAGAAIPVPNLSGSASLDAAASEVSAPFDAVASRPTRIFDLELGDCIEPRSPGTPADPVLSGEVDRVEVVGCNVPHTYELIDVIVHDGPSSASFPGNDVLSRYGSERCAEHFEGIVGTPFLQSELDVILSSPTKGSWRLGDREIQCLAFRMDGRPLEDTVVGSGL
jgi:hypothetical protein